MSFEEFQDSCHGGHLGYPKGTVLAMLKFLCCSNVSHQVLAQSYLRFGRRCRLKYFKMAIMVREEMPFEEFQDGRRAAILDIGTERF